MHFSEISNIRLANQQVTLKTKTSVKDLVGYMGAVQAQDHNMAKWAIGKRLEDVNEKMVDAAIDNAEIIRTHLLRPTWHIVSSDDIYRMLELTAPHIKSAVQSRQNELNLDEKTLVKIYRLIEKSLRDGNHLTREELYSIFHKNKISTSDNRGAHILMGAELEGIICSGAIKNKKQTFALLEERVPKPKAQFSRDETLQKLAKTYFTSHAPATLKDFVWWSGLPVRDARKSLEMLGKDFISENIDSEIYWRNRSQVDFPKTENSVLLLPAFDEFLIAYTDRKASIALGNNKKAIWNNGIFRPIIVVNGQVVGIWKRTSKKDKVIVETGLFKPLNKYQLDLLKKEIIALGAFLGKHIELSR